MINEFSSWGSDAKNIADALATDPTDLIKSMANVATNLVALPAIAIALAECDQEAGKEKNIKAILPAMEPETTNDKETGILITGGLMARLENSDIVFPDPIGESELDQDIGSIFSKP